MELSFLTELARQAMEQHTPMSGQFELTPVCNLKCAMCYVHKPEEDGIRAKKLLPASFFIQKAQEAKEQGMLVLSLTGGETLTYPYIDELMAELTKMGLLISFNTNGTLVDEQRVEWFKQYPPTKINISLYGASNETYEVLCKVKNGFDKTAKAIEMLQEAGLNVYLNAVIVPENVQELPQMHRFAKAHQLVLHTTSYIFPARGCAGCTTHRLDAIDGAKAYAVDRLMTTGSVEFKQQAANISYRLDQLEKLPTWHSDFGECRAAISSFAINWQGQMQPCVMYDHIQVDLKNRSFSEGWQLLQEKMAEVKVPEKCANCRQRELCPVCKASVYQETASETRAPEYLCTYTNTLRQILRKEGNGVAIQVSDSGDFHHRGCTD